MHPTSGLYLRIAGGLHAGFGLLTAIGAHPALDWPLQLMGDIIFWPIDGGPAIPDDPAVRLLAAICGGVLVGWGVTLWLLGSGVAVIRAAVIGAVAWYCVDSAFSAVAGAPFNVVLNLALLAPVLLAARQMAASRQPAAR